MGRRRKRGRSVRRNVARAGDGDADEAARAPHSFVVHRGSVGKSVQELVRDFRKVMEPNTASNVKVRPRNVVKDFVHVAGVLGVSHLCMFTKTERGPYLKLARFPRGPTLTFRIKDYVLARDVRSSLRRQVTYEKQYLVGPLLILNSFTGKLPSAEGSKDGDDGGTRAMELLASMLQNMFPSINVNTVKVNSIRRCVLLNYDPESGLVDFRHYTIKVVPVGVSRAVRKIVQGKVPNLSRFDDVSEFLDGGGGAASESEPEDDEASKVTLPQAVSSRGNLPQQQSSVRLVELGPRMLLEPTKVEEGLLEGEVLYHRLVAKTEEERRELRATREKRKREREARKKQQEENVKRKQRLKDEQREKALKGMKKAAPVQRENEESEDDDDAKWFEDEVGEKPDKDLLDFPAGRKRKKGSVGGSTSLPKRFKMAQKKGSGDRRNSNTGGGGRGGGGGEKGGGVRGGKKVRRPTKGQFSKQGVGPGFKTRKPSTVGKKTKKGGQRRGK